MLFASRTISCQLSHQELPKTRLFLYPQTVQLKQADVWLRVTEYGKRHRAINCETCLNGWRNLRKAWWTEIQSNLEVIENILQKHLLLSLYLATEKEENTIYSRIFWRVHIVKSGPSTTRDKNWWDNNSRSQDPQWRRILAIAAALCCCGTRFPELAM